MNGELTSGPGRGVLYKLKTLNQDWVNAIKILLKEIISVVSIDGLVWSNCQGVVIGSMVRLRLTQQYSLYVVTMELYNIYEEISQCKYTLTFPILWALRKCMSSQIHVVPLGPQVRTTMSLCWNTPRLQYTAIEALVGFGLWNCFPAYFLIKYVDPYACMFAILCLYLDILLWCLYDKTSTNCWFVW